MVAITTEDEKYLQLQLIQCSGQNILKTNMTIITCNGRNYNSGQNINDK